MNYKIIKQENCKSMKSVKKIIKRCLIGILFVVLTGGVVFGISEYKRYREIPVYRNVHRTAIYLGVIKRSSLFASMPLTKSSSYGFWVGSKYDKKIKNLKPGDIVNLELDIASWPMYYDAPHSTHDNNTYIRKIHHVEIVTKDYLQMPQEGIIKVNTNMEMEEYIYRPESYLLYEETGEIVLCYGNKDNKVCEIVSSSGEKWSYKVKYTLYADDYIYDYFADRELSEEELMEKIESKSDEIFFVGKVPRRK